MVRTWPGVPTDLPGKIAVDRAVVAAGVAQPVTGLQDELVTDTGRSNPAVRLSGRGSPRSQSDRNTESDEGHEAITFAIGGISGLSGPIPRLKILGEQQCLAACGPFRRSGPSPAARRASGSRWSEHTRSPSAPLDQHRSILGARPPSLPSDRLVRRQMTRRDFVKLLRHPTLGHDALLEQDLKTSSPVLAQTPCRTRADGFPLASKDKSFSSRNLMLA